MIWLVKKITNKITNVSKKLQQNNSETVTNKLDKETPKEKYVYLQKKDKEYWWTEIKIVY